MVTITARSFLVAILSPADFVPQNIYTGNCSTNLVFCQQVNLLALRRKEKNMNFLSKYFGFIIQAVLAVQAAVPTMKGENKKQLATTLITLGAGIAGNAPESHVKAIGQAIDKVVPILQASGLMAKDAESPVVAASATGSGS